MSSSVLLFLDYDGTLVGFQDVPRKAVLSPARRRFLRDLSRVHRVVIVSGRSLAEIRRLVGLPGIAYIGNHGLEMELGGRTWVHPLAVRLQPVLQAALERIARASRDIPGPLIEDKGLTASVHFRPLTPATARRVRRIVRREMRPDLRSLRLVAGNKVWEIRPRVRWDKGSAVSEMRRWLGPAGKGVPVYLGDDRTDEDAFRELRPDGVTFRVGRSGRTMALGRLPDVPAVWRFLRLFR
jgi:trehalose-phosphatase